MKTLTQLTLSLTLTLFLFSCGETSQTTQEEPYGNPAAEGFNEAESDAKAIAIADEVMEAMGGRSMG